MLLSATGLVKLHWRAARPRPGLPLPSRLVSCDRTRLTFRSAEKFLETVKSHIEVFHACGIRQPQMTFGAEG